MTISASDLIVHRSRDGQQALTNQNQNQKLKTKTKNNTHFISYLTAILRAAFSIFFNIISLSSSRFIWTIFMSGNWFTRYPINWWLNFSVIIGPNTTKSCFACFTRWQSCVYRIAFPTTIKAGWFKNNSSIPFSMISLLSAIMILLSAITNFFCQNYSQ